MAAMKELRKYGTVVFIDFGEVNKLPEAIRGTVLKAAKSGGGAVPFGVVMNVSHTKTYGFFNYSRPCKSYQSARLSDIDVAQHGE